MTLQAPITVKQQKTSTSRTLHAVFPLLEVPLSSVALGVIPAVFVATRRLKANGKHQNHEQEGMLHSDTAL